MKKPRIDASHLHRQLNRVALSQKAALWIQVYKNLKEVAEASRKGSFTTLPGWDPLASVGICLPAATHS